MSDILYRTKAKAGRGILAEYERAMELRRLVRDHGLTAEKAPDIVAAAERQYGRIQVHNAVDDAVGELVLDGPVWASEWAYPDEISPANVRKALEKLGEVKRVNIYLNSPGGDLYAGHAIHGMLRRHPAEVVVYVEGLAASAASIIAVGADRLMVAPNSTFMIHSAMAGMLGWFNAQDLREIAATLDQADKSIVAVYAMKTGRDEKELFAMVRAETWMVGQEIVDEGFADELVGGETAPEANVTNQKALISDEDVERALETAEKALDDAGWPDDEPDKPEPGMKADGPPDDEKLKLLSLELELLSAAPF